MPSAESGEPTSKLSGPYRDRLLTLLREKAYEKRDVILASGRRSNFYIDCRRVVLTAEGHFLTGMLFNEAMHFCSDMPFHLRNDGREDLSVAIYLTGVRLINEFLAWLGHRFDGAEWTARAQQEMGSWAETDWTNAG